MAVVFQSNIAVWGGRVKSNAVILLGKMMETYVSILLAIGTLILGWGLGIFGTIINEKLKRKSTKEDIKTGIKTELNELQIHLTSVCIMSVFITDKFTKEFFLWVKPYFIKFSESAAFLIPKKIKDSMPKISEIDDDTLYALLIAAYGKNSTTSAAISFTYQNVTTPYIDLKINDISLLNNILQKSLFTLKRDINFLNGDISQIWFYHSKTFDNPTQDNLELLNANLNNLYERISRRSKIMVEKIDETLNELNKK